MRELGQRKDESQQMIMSQEQEEEIARFREEKIRINRELKDVRKKLRADIETLFMLLKTVNNFFMAFCVSLAGIAFGLYRQRRMRKE